MLFKGFLSFLKALFKGCFMDSYPSLGLHERLMVCIFCTDLHTCAKRHLHLLLLLVLHCPSLQLHLHPLLCCTASAAVYLWLEFSPSKKSLLTKLWTSWENLLEVLGFGRPSVITCADHVILKRLPNVSEVEFAEPLLLLAGEALRQHGPEQQQNQCDE